MVSFCRLSEARSQDDYLRLSICLCRHSSSSYRLYSLAILDATDRLGHNKLSLGRCPSAYVVLIWKAWLTYIVLDSVYCVRPKREMMSVKNLFLNMDMFMLNAERLDYVPIFFKNFK